MALWGKTDTLASAPKYITRKAFFGTAAVNTTDNTIDLRSSNTDYATGDGVVYFNGGGTSLAGLTSGNTYYVYRTAVAGVIKLSDTEAHAKAGTDFIDLTGTGNAAQYLQRNAEGNESTAPDNGDHTYNGQDLFFVDINEAQQPENRARGLKSPGWWSYRTYTNTDGSVQHKTELIVALGGQTDKLQVTTGDLGTNLRPGNTDDATVLDSTVTIVTQPANASVTEPATATFSVVASITGAGTLTYQWQVQEGGAGAWTNVTRGSGGTTDTYTTGATQVAASGTADSNGDKYRCIVGASTANTDVTSNAATLTVTL